MGIKIITNNKKAHFEYFIEDTFECGIELKGTEVKSLRLGNCSIQESICKIINNECYIFSMNINPYERGNIFNVDSMRVRKLLLHKQEIKKIAEKIKLKGYTLIPTKVYFKDSKVKVEIAVAKGKKLYDKREDIKKKDMSKDINKNIKKVIKNFCLVLLMIFSINNKINAAVYGPSSEMQQVLNSATVIDNNLPSNNQSEITNSEKKAMLHQAELDNPLNAGYWQLDTSINKYRYYRYNKYANGYEMLTGRVYSIYDKELKLNNYYFNALGELITENTVFGPYLFVIDPVTNVIKTVIPISHID